MDKVLILTSDETQAKDLKSGLEKMHQFAVNFATRGKDALALFDTLKISVFVTDISPPDMDALDILSYMTLHRPNVPIIIMTDHGKPWFKEQMAKQSFLYHLEKPFKTGSLASAIVVGLHLRDEGKHFQGMTMASVLPLVEILQKTCRMEARSTNQEKGYLYFNKGVLFDAHYNDLRGEAAAREIASLKGISIKLSELPLRRTRTRVKTNLMEIAGAFWDKKKVDVTPADDAITSLSNGFNTENDDPTAVSPDPPGPPDKSIGTFDNSIPLSIETEPTRNGSNPRPDKVPHEKDNPVGAAPGTSDGPPPSDKIAREIPASADAEKDPAEAAELLLEDLSLDDDDKPEPSKTDNRPFRRDYRPKPVAGMAMDVYLEHFQLVQKPFQINTDPSFLWIGEKQKEALATLSYGLQENKGFLLLTGDVGVGKTTIVEAMLQALGPNDLAVVVNNPIMEPLDFFNYVARSFGLPGKYAAKGDFLEAFGNFLLTSHYKGQRVLLIIDECQLLEPSLLNEIRLFLNFEKKGTLLINIFFVGQLEFKKMLLQSENRAIRQRIAVSYSIPPLSLKETEKYIDYRLAVAGNDKKIFKTGAIREIYHFSKGYPRLINIIADRALLTGYIHSARQIKKGIIKECAEEMDFPAIDKNQ